MTTPNGTPPSRADHATAMAAYAAEREARVAELGVRGPLELGPDERLHPDIVAAYSTHGFYIFEGVVDDDEVIALRSAVEDVIDRAPTHPGADLDRHGRPALGRDHAVDPFLLTKPLSDPWGGTKLLAGRHPTQMTQPDAGAEAPDYIVHLMFGMCVLMPEALRLYGHPDLLAAAASINGDDFLHHNDAILVNSGSQRRLEVSRCPERTLCRRGVLYPNSTQRERLGDARKCVLTGDDGVSGHHRVRAVTFDAEPNVGCIHSGRNRGEVPD